MDELQSCMSAPSESVSPTLQMSTPQQEWQRLVSVALLVILLAATWWLAHGEEVPETLVVAAEEPSPVTVEQPMSVGEREARPAVLVDQEDNGEGLGDNSADLSDVPASVDVVEEPAQPVVSPQPDSVDSSDADTPQGYMGLPEDF